MGKDITAVKNKRKIIRKLLPAMIYKDFDTFHLYVITIDRPVYLKLETKAMSANEISLPTNKKLDVSYRGPKRYETSCYFKPLAVPVWYSTSIMLKVNSTKKKFTESVTYKNKLVPYRYVEKMTTVTSKPPKFISNLEIQREVPLEHYLSLEPQQKAALNKPFSTDRSITIDNYS